MAVEEAVSVKAAGSGGTTVTLNAGDFTLESIEWGNPPRRDEMVSSADSNGALPIRTLPKDNREVVARVRVERQASTDLAIAKLLALEAILETSERVASEGIYDPATDPVRFLYVPADSTSSVILPIYSGFIEEIPKEVTGDNAGWFLKQPVFTIRCVCDPLFIDGTLDTLVTDTQTGDPFARVIDVPAAGGSAKPLIYLKLEEQEAIARNQLLISMESPATTDSLIITPANLVTTNFTGTLSSGRIVVAGATDWVGACSTGSLPHAQTYRVIALAAQGNGKIRFRYGVEGDPQSLNAAVDVPGTLWRDVDLGAITVERPAGGTWLGVVEVYGSISFEGLLIVPTKAWAAAETEPGSSSLGTRVVEGNLTGTGTLAGHSLTQPGAQTWSLVAGTWTKVTGAVQRTSVSEGSRQIALAGTSNYAGVALFCDVTAMQNSAADYASEIGIVLRYVDASNYAVLRLRRFSNDGAWVLDLRLVIGGTEVPPNHTDPKYNTFLNPGVMYFFGVNPGLFWAKLGCAIDTQGRWQVYFLYPSADQNGVDNGKDPVLITSGIHPALASGGALATGKVGLSDRWAQAVANTRQFRNFKAYGNPISTSPILPASKSIEFTESGMVRVDGSNRARINHRGGIINPDHDRASRLMVVTRRFAGVSETVAAGKNDNQRTTVYARKRYVQVPG